MTTENYLVVCTHVGKPCSDGNQTERTAKVKTINHQVADINHQVTDRSENYQTDRDAMVAASLTTDVTVTALHTQSVGTVTVAVSPVTNNVTANSVRSINNNITSNGSGSSVTNCTVSVTAAATSVTNSRTSISSMTSSTTFSNPNTTTYSKATSKGQVFNVHFVGCTTAQSSMPACISVCL